MQLLTEDLTSRGAVYYSKFSYITVIKCCSFRFEKFKVNILSKALAFGSEHKNNKSYCSQLLNISALSKVTF